MELRAKVEKDKFKKNCCQKMKTILGNFDKFYMQPLFIKNIEGENPLSDKEKKIQALNKAWGIKQKEDEQKTREQAEEFLI